MKPIYRDLLFMKDSLFPVLRQVVETGYFTLEVKGLERIPDHGPIIYAGNHSGWFALDGLMFLLMMHDSLGADQLPFGIAHDLLFRVPGISSFCSRIGLVPASVLGNPATFPKQIDRLAVAPEGSPGNCKPFWKAYEMQEWKTGFVRLALLQGAKVVPCTVVGGEECLPVAWTFRWLEKTIRSPLPVPLSLLPFPTRWKFMLLDPVDFNQFDRERWNDYNYCKSLARSIQRTVQTSLNDEAQRAPLRRFSSTARRFQKFGQAHRVV